MKKKQNNKNGKRVKKAKLREQEGGCRGRA